MELEIKKIGRSFCIVCGAAVLGKFPTEPKATNALATDRKTYEFWAGSAGVSIQNTPAKVVNV